MTKTNVMRMLDAEKITYSTAEYEYSEDDLSGVHAAEAINMPAEQVFKTLVTKGDKTGPIVFVIPVAEELDLKKAARVSHNKSIEMLHVKDLLGLTGYIRGGCSPIGMKKKFTTYIDETAVLFDNISISAGMRGVQVIINPEALVEFIDAKQADLTA
ncbi:MAG: Cys-tRNA(Pro) deacylase [Lachnospiraceae bacterium]|nr:Cys-tRNA(Pro) deacylase [Lachnospiraceae bacterium]